MKVNLRPVVEGDAQRVLAWRNLPGVSRYMLSDRPIEPDEHLQWFTRILDDPRRRDWIIESDRSPVGLMSLTDIDEDNRRCSWGFYLASPTERGKGIGSSAWYQALCVAFDERGMEKVCSEVLSTNIAVVGLHESFGFRREAYLREHVRHGTERIDVVGLALLRREWELCRPGIELRLQQKRLLRAEGDAT